MAYEDFEDGVSTGAPVECYRFIGSFREYLYTSADEPVTLDGRTYQPAAISRDSLRAGTQEDDTLALELTLPHDTTVVREYAYADSPPALSLEVFRVHRDSNFVTDFILMWKGEVISFSVDGRTATLSVPSIFARALQGDVPTIYWQGPCNHVLFDNQCGLNRADYITETSILLVSGTDIEVVDQGFADNFLVSGEMVNLRTGERRLITFNQANLLKVRVKFADARVGDTVQLSAGCDHSFTTCKAKFSNGLRFGGHPFIPADNPFNGEL